VLVWLAITAGAVAVSLLLQYVLIRILLRLVRSHPLVDRAIRHLRAPTRMLNVVIVISISFRYLDDVSVRTRAQIDHLIVLATIAAFAWFLVRLVGALVEGRSPSCRCRRRTTCAPERCRRSSPSCAACPR
jgi:hypothetical protein